MLLDYPGGLSVTASSHEGGRRGGVVTKGAKSEEATLLALKMEEGAQELSSAASF